MKHVRQLEFRPPRRGERYHERLDSGWAVAMADYDEPMWVLSITPTPTRLGWSLVAVNVGVVLWLLQDVVFW